MSQEKQYSILGEVSVIQKAGFYALVVCFCILMGLLIYDRQFIDSRIIAAASITVYFLTLFFIYSVKKSMADKLDQTGEQLEILATTDELTQAFNRKHFNKLFDKELERSRRYEKEFCCLALDIDNFKIINNKYGHQTGDEILQDISDLMKDNLRLTDIHARYGDNRFMCLLPETNMEQSVNFSKRLRRLLEGKKVLHRDTNEAVNTTISIGIAACNPVKDKDVGSNDIINQAETALENAKKSGGNRIQCYPEIPTES